NPLRDGMAHTRPAPQRGGATAPRRRGDAFGLTVGSLYAMARCRHEAAALREVTHVGRPVGVHIGIAGGQVVASQTGSENYSEYTVTGNAANLASRLTRRRRGRRNLGVA